MTYMFPSMRISRMEGGLTGFTVTTRNGSLLESLNCPDTYTSYIHTHNTEGEGAGVCVIHVQWNMYMHVSSDHVHVHACVI